MDAATSPSPASSRWAPWKSPAIILVAGAALMAVGRFNPFLPDVGHKNLALIVAAAITVVALAIWLWRALRRRGGNGHLVFGAMAIIALGIFVATMRADYMGDLRLTWRPRNWVLNLYRKAGGDLGDVIHRDRLADPPLVITPSPDDAPRFFGPNVDGHFHFEPGKLARDWTTKPPRELWRVKVGPAWSSFAVVGGYGFTQEETSDLASEQVTCYDLATGAVQWVHGDPGAFTSSMGGDGPRATPTFFEGKIVTTGALGLLNCFDAATGRRLWSRNPVEENDGSVPMWGYSPSPLAFHSEKHGDVVVVPAGGANGKSLHAYRLDDGKEVWSVGNDAVGYATPVLKTLGGVQQIVMVNWQEITGHDPETGAELWRFNDPNHWESINPKVPQPLVLDDRRVLITAGYSAGAFMLDVVKNADGKWSATSQWRSTKLRPKFMNPVVYNEHVYGLDDGNFLVCLSLADGELKWRSKRGADYDHGQILLLDDLLVVQSEAGDVALVAADPTEYRELSRFTALPQGKSWNQPTFFGRKLLVRNDVEAVCYELPAE